MSDKKRETGFYWAKHFEDEDYKIWYYWVGYGWKLDDDYSLPDEYFDEIDEKQIKRDSSIQFEINILSKYIEHPTKPGYKRKDIVDRIKELQKQLDE